MLMIELGFNSNSKIRLRGEDCPKQYIQIQLFLSNRCRTTNKKKLEINMIDPVSLFSIVVL